MRASQPCGAHSDGWRRADLGLWSWGDPRIVRADYRGSQKADESPDKVGRAGDPEYRSRVIRAERALQLALTSPRGPRGGVRGPGGVSWEKASTPGPTWRRSWQPPLPTLSLSGGLCSLILHGSPRKCPGKAGGETKTGATEGSGAQGLT